MQRRLVASVALTCVACFGILAIALGLGWAPKLGLDLRGGLSVTYQPARKISNAELQTVVNIMQERANALGISQPNIAAQGNNVAVELPGVKDTQTVLNTIGTTAQLYFRPVLCGAPPYTPPSAAKGTKPKAVAYKTPPACDGAYQYTTAYFNASSGVYNPPAPDPKFATYPSLSQGQDQTHQKVPVILKIEGSSQRYVLGPVLASGTIIKSAYASLSQQQGWLVVFNLTSKGTTTFNNIAKTYYQNVVANDLDGVVISAPSINSTSFPGSGQISGNFTQASASKLGLELSYGSFPVQMNVLTSQTISPSLGAASLRAGLFAGLLGLLLVMIYTIVYYRALGIVVVLGLVTTAAFLYGLISILGHTSTGLTLDLSGVTGLIVSVGITVDSYIVYFERLKDEIRAGRSVRASVDRGFRSAYRTILSADAVSFIGALVLWLLSVGAVRGFAFMLGLSTLVDVITAYFFTRPLVILLGRNRIFTEARRLGVARGLAAAPRGAADTKEAVA
ncbi:MAG TPA: protein translocase subunit SecD [Acidimicrobiales bacterium]|nr:protein translocase subunit SecD [Acidimicrobiales bacterium]